MPQPVVDRSAADLRAYIDGTDPVSKRPFMQEVIDGLTRPLDEADLQGQSFERTTPRLLEPDTEDHLQRLFEENHWTDFLPIVAADRGTRRGHAQGDEPSTGRGGGTAAAGGPSASSGNSPWRRWR